jgi:ribosomal-protein-alanine N-acetyltransferase
MRIVDKEGLYYQTSGGVKISIQWMVRRDMPQVLEIENECCRGEQFKPWEDDDFVTSLRQRNCIGMVAEQIDSKRILGFVVYELQKSTLRILNLSVHPFRHREGIGTELVDKLANKVSQQRRTTMSMTVRERNMGGLLFLRSCGFKAERSIRGHFEDTGEDGIEMVFRKGEK